MTKIKTTANNTNPAGSQRKKTTNPRPNATPQNNTPTTNTQPPQPQTQNRKNKQNPAQNQSQTQSQIQDHNQSQTQSQASTKPSSPAPPKTSTPPPPKVETHVPLDGFNATEIDELLNSGCDPSAMVYKPEEPIVQKSPWGQKSGTMATGKDFWIELRKQIAILQKGESTNKGG